MRVLISMGLAISLLGCTPTTRNTGNSGDTASMSGQLTGCRFEFSANGGATGLCMASDGAMKLSFPSCGAGKPDGPSVQPADERAVLSRNACISSFGGEKWVVDHGAS